MLGVAATLPIEVHNEAGVPPARLETILSDFRAWGLRVHEYYGVAPRPVVLRLTRRVPFGFYRDGVVMLPPSDDRQALLEDWVHEITHHLLGRDSSFFLREGAATHSVDALFARERLTPRGWPYFGRRCDAWVALFHRRGQLPPLADLRAWPRYRGGTAEDDFRSWQVYLAGCSYVGWVFARRGLAGFREAFASAGGGLDVERADAEWRRAVMTAGHAAFDPADRLPPRARYRNYADRLR